MNQDPGYLTLSSVNLCKILPQNGIYFPINEHFFSNSIEGLLKDLFYLSEMYREFLGLELVFPLQ